jgi:hypothetical protein
MNMIGGLAERVRELQFWVDPLGADPADVVVLKQVFPHPHIGLVFGAAHDVSAPRWMPK